MQDTRTARLYFSLKISFSFQVEMYICGSKKTITRLGFTIAILMILLLTTCVLDIGLTIITPNIDVPQARSFGWNYLKNMTVGESTKYILYYNAQDGNRYYGPQCYKTGPRMKITQGCGKESFSQCEVKDCFLTFDKNLLPSMGDFAAVIFHPRMTARSSILENGIDRQPHQKFVFWIMESPAYPENVGRYTI